MEGIHPAVISNIMNDYWKLITGKKGIKLDHFIFKNKYVNKGDKEKYTCEFFFSLVDPQSLESCNQNESFILGAFFGFINSAKDKLVQNLFEEEPTKLNINEATIAENQMHVENKHNSIIFKISIEIWF